MISPVAQDSSEYRALQKQYELLVQQLDTAQNETRAHRETAEKTRMDAFMLKNQLDSGTASVRFELESAKAEVARLTHTIEALRTDLETTKKENAQVLCSTATADYRTTVQYT